MNFFTCDGINDLFFDVGYHLINCGSEVAVDRPGAEDSTTIELLGFRAFLLNPKHNVLLIPSRRNDPFALLYEVAWVLGGRTDVSKFDKYHVQNVPTLSYFLPRSVDYADDGAHWRAGYGQRIANWNGRGVNQISHVLNTLARDKTSRQAVINIWDPEEEAKHAGITKDMPCCNHVQFIIRDNLLHTYVTQRSGDFLWGFTNVNVYEFTIMQMLFAEILGVGVGTYTHNVNSLHVYKNKLGRLRKSLEGYDVVRFDENGVMPVCPRSISWDPSDPNVGKSICDHFYHMTRKIDVMITKILFNNNDYVEDYIEKTIMDHLIVDQDDIKKNNMWLWLLMFGVIMKAPTKLPKSIEQAVHELLKTNLSIAKSIYIWWEHERNNKS